MEEVEGMGSLFEPQLRMHNNLALKQYDMMTASPQKGTNYSIFQM